MKRLTEIKKRKEEKNSSHKSKKKLIISIIIVGFVVIVSSAGYYFFFFNKNFNKKPETEITLTEQQKLEIVTKVNDLMELFLEQIRLKATINTGDITPYLAPTSSGHKILTYSIPDGWIDYEGVIIGDVKVIDKEQVEVEIEYPLASQFGNKFMNIQYKVSYLPGQWLISDIISQIIKDHGITIWPIKQDTEELEQIQGNIRDHLDSWRLDPLKTAEHEAPANGFLPDDSFELITDKYTWVPKVGTYEAVVKATHQDQIFYILLSQPFIKGYQGVWSIKSIERNQPNI